jgi:hypothetical protein
MHVATDTMLNKYNAALLATVIYGILFPLVYQVFAQDHVRPVSVALSAVIFFFIMVGAFGKILGKRGATGR